MPNTPKAMHVTVKAGVKPLQYAVVIDRAFRRTTLEAALAEQLTGCAYEIASEDDGRTFIKLAISQHENRRLFTSMLRDIIVSLAVKAGVRPANVIVEHEGRMAPMSLLELCDLLNRAGDDHVSTAPQKTRQRPLIYPKAKCHVPTMAQAGSSL